MRSSMFKSSTIRSKSKRKGDESMSMGSISDMKSSDMIS